MKLQAFPCHTKYQTFNPELPTRPWAVRRTCPANRTTPWAAQGEHYRYPHHADSYFQIWTPTCLFECFLKNGPRWVCPVKAPFSPKCDGVPRTNWQSGHLSSHWQRWKCIKINLCACPTPTCSLDMTLYKAITVFSCLLAGALTPHAQLHPQRPPQSTSSFSCVCVYMNSHSMTQQNPRHGAWGWPQRFSQERRKHWLREGDLKLQWSLAISPSTVHKSFTLNVILQQVCPNFFICGLKLSRRKNSWATKMRM